LDDGPGTSSPAEDSERRTYEFHKEERMNDEERPSTEGDAEPSVPRTTTTGNEEQDFRQFGDGSIQEVDRNDPRDPRPEFSGHREDDELLPDTGDDEDASDEELGEIERPAANPTDRPYGDSLGRHGSEPT
jgi:hypothetical protein